VRKHTPKRVPECLRLRNYIIFVTIFSLVDFKKEAKQERRRRKVPPFNRSRQGEKKTSQKLHEVSRGHKVWPH
jgi:hypothetical protein